MMNKFNLIEESWIPVANEGLVSLNDIFTKDFVALGGTPTQKIAVTKLLLAIAQAAYTPLDEKNWEELGDAGLKEKALKYLEDKRNNFWLFGENPFLQLPEIKSAKVQPFGALTSGVATGNTTILTQSQIERKLCDAEIALLIVELQNFAFGGKKTDNAVILSNGYQGKYNEKKKPKTGKPATAIGFLGFLHSFVLGRTISETLYLNLLTTSQIEMTPHFKGGLGNPPWEKMPQGEDCQIAKELQTTYLGRLVPLCRFILATEGGMHYSEGILYPGYAEGSFDLTSAVDYSKDKPRALWVNIEKKPWTQLTSLLGFLGSEKSDFDCYQLRYALPRLRKIKGKVGIWTGGIKVSNNAGEQFLSGTDDYIESEFNLESSWLGEAWIFHLKNEMLILEKISKNIYVSALNFYKQQSLDGKGKAELTSNLFWQLSEPYFQNLVESCGKESPKEMRSAFVMLAHRSYDYFCSKDTIRQIDAWAANRPKLEKYL